MGGIVVVMAVRFHSELISKSATGWARLWLTLTVAELCAVCNVNIFLFTVACKPSGGLYAPSHTIEEGKRLMSKILKTVSFLTAIGVLFTAGCQRPGPSKSTDQSRQSDLSNQPGQSSQSGAYNGSSQANTADRTGSTRITDSIVEVVKGAGTFNTLVKALQSAGLTDTLSKGGPYTLFAPTDAAFAQLPPGQLDSWMKSENREKLQKILKYHVVDGRITADQLKQNRTLKTMEGATLTVKEQNGKWYVNDAMIESANMDAANGVIHSINKVLTPPANP